MFLGGELISRRNAELFESGFVEEHVQQCSYDLRLGAEYYTVGHKAPAKLTLQKPYIALSPGQFAILTCAEVLHLPQTIMGFITLRNRYKMQGLVNVSGFHVDPLFKGRLVFAVQNVGPNDIRLKFEDATFTIFFAEVNEPKVKPRQERMGIQLPDVQQLGAASLTLTKLKRDVDTIRTLLLIYAPFAVALVIALIMNIVRSMR
jgi:dCTP deaminase